MKTKIFAMLMLVVLSLAPAALAQMGSQGSGAQDQSNMTVTGCLQAGTEPDTFMLSNVSMASGESGATPNQMARAESSYMLIPDGNVQLKKHVGEKVQVTGMPSQMGDQSSSSSSSGSSAGSSSGMNQPAQFRVSSIKKIGSTCP